MPIRQDAPRDDPATATTPPAGQGSSPAEVPQWALPGQATAPVEVQETRAYRLKRRLLGPPLISDQLATERLGKPTALAVLSSDVMSSSAYATEEILRILLPVGGLVAFRLVTPITALILAVLGVVTICYREVVKSYPKAGGSYVVSRDNFGPNIAQVAGAALLISYTITVAVSVAAGVDAVISVAPALQSDAVPLSVAAVVLLAYGNLRGLREAGRVFALPTYFFIANMAALIIVGLVRAATGHLGHVATAAGQLPLGHATGGLIGGISLFIAARAFANGGSAMTGTEAISNGVSVFRDPQARNARTTLVIMSLVLGSMFLGVSILAALVHARPFVSGTPTVVSEIGRLVYGGGALGSTLYGLLQAATALILVLAANTSFTGFPFLVSFVAEDSFLPRPLTVRGHRLVYSNGIAVLAVVSIALLLATGAKVAALIPMYAIGVFTGFTMAGAGMAKHHLHHREPGWRRSVGVNVTAAIVCFVVVVIFSITEFTRGAWVVVVVMPLLVYGLMKTNAQYRAEDAALDAGVAAEASTAPVLRWHDVIVLVDRLDLATARAIQYARNLSPHDLYAVHFDLDRDRAEELIRRWGELGLSELPLEVIEVPDRRLGRAALELAARAAGDGETEVSVLLPMRSYQRSWGTLLHGKNADRLVRTLGHVPHVNPTLVPFNVADVADADRSLRGVQEYLHGAGLGAGGGGARGGGGGGGGSGSGGGGGRPGGGPGSSPPPRGEPAGMTYQEVPGATPIAEVRYRQRARVAGRIRSVRVQPWGGAPSLECILGDASNGEILAVFLGRRDVPGIRPGTQVVVEGTVGQRRGRLAILNPRYQLLSVREAPPSGEG